MKPVRFHGGVHPLASIHGGKDITRDIPVRDFVSDTVMLAMDMHLGAPSIPCVKKGDHVLMGQVVGEPNGPRGIPVHASVSGEVTDVCKKQLIGRAESTVVIIRNDFKDEWVPLSGCGNVENCDPALILPAIRDAGIMGMGGAGFPTHVKLAVPEGKYVDTIIVNGAECETFLNADARLMIETPLRVVDGLRAVMRALNVERGFIAIEDNKPEAISAVRRACEGRTGVEVCVLPARYPQGSEKQLIYAVTGREVPSGALPADAHCVVLNAASSAAIADAVIDGRPLVDRIVTVSGAVRKPANLRLRIGTIVLDVIGECGGYSAEPGKLLFGGTMTGQCMPNDTVPTYKSHNGITVLTEKEALVPPESSCIRCGRCMDVCPMKLNPFLLKNLIDAGRLADAKQNHLLDCMLCGTCAYVCPARRWLTASFRDAKELIRARRI